MRTMFTMFVRLLQLFAVDNPADLIEFLESKSEGPLKMAGTEKTHAIGMKGQRSAVLKRRYGPPQGHFTSIQQC